MRQLHNMDPPMPWRRYRDLMDGATHFKCDRPRFRQFLNKKVQRTLASRHRVCLPPYDDATALCHHLYAVTAGGTRNGNPYQLL